MIGALIVIMAVGSFTSRASTKPATSHLSAPSHPLWKPEPAALLSNGSVRLTVGQRQKVSALQVGWAAEKDRLIQAMKSFTPKQGRQDQISEGLQGYSELSRTYDSTRESYWRRALALLDPAQRTAAGGPQ